MPDDFIAALNRPDLRSDNRYELVESLRVALTNNPVRYCWIPSLHIVVSFI